MPLAVTPCAASSRASEKVSDAERALGHRVRRAGGQAAGLGGERAGVDDAAPAPRLHRRHHRLRPEERAVEVGAEHAAPFVGVGRLDLLLDRMPALLTRMSTSPSALDDVRVRGAHRRRVADVAGDGERRVAEFARERRIDAAVEVDQRDPAAVFEQRRARRRGPSCRAAPVTSATLPCERSCRFMCRARSSCRTGRASGR